LGDDTMVHVTMNYAPPSRILRPVVASLSGHMEGLVEKVLREFKASVESRPKGVVRSGSQPGAGTQMTDLSRTGTFGDQPREIEPRFGGTTNPGNSPTSSDVKR
jgi:hypothetical protein